MNLNVHFHTGVFIERPPGRLEFHAAPPPGDAAVTHVLVAIRRRVRRLLARRGLEPDTAELGSPDGLADASPILAQILSASVQSRVALGRRAGTRVGRLGAMPPDLAAAARGLRQAHLDGFDLHANVRVPPNDGARLEHLCRYLLRPPLVQDRLRNIIDSLSTRNFNYISVRSFILDGAPPKSIISLIWFGGVRNLANMAAI
jgi:hypothetical protein